MKAFIGKSSWVVDEGLRLDASTYSSGGLEAREKIQRGKLSWERLDKLANIFNGPRFVRNYVYDPKRGIPFLSSSDMLLADLQGISSLSSKATLPSLLKSLMVKAEWTLISCSGTIGRTVFVRGELDGMTASQDIMRIVPFEQTLWPGYLFAFLSCAPAQAMIKQKTYGNVILHIEPQHIADLPVPLLCDAEQQRVHNLIVNAGQARTEASKLLSEAAAYFDKLAGTMPSSHDHARSVGITQYSCLNLRLDAFHHVGWATEGGSYSGTPIGELGQVTRPGIIKRIFVERGVPFISGIDAFQIRVPYRQFIMRSEAAKSGDLIKEHQILVQRSGQRYGLIGRPAYVGKHMNGWAASEHLMRITLSNERNVARVFAFLRSELGHRTLLRSSYGTSIPELNPEGLAAVKVPSMPEKLIANVAAALALREQADADEELAIREVEQWVNSLH